MKPNLVKSWVFGTGEDCDVRISGDPYVSIRHCKVTLYEDGTATVEDLGSTNGTFIRREGQSLSPLSQGGARVLLKPMTISPGVIIRIGRTDIPWRKP